MAQRGGPGARGRQPGQGKAPKAKSDSEEDPEKTTKLPQEPRDWAPRRQLMALGLFLLLFVLVAVLASLSTPELVLDDDGAPMLDDDDRPVVHYGWLSLLPALVAIVLAFATRQVILALFLGIVTGGVVFAFGAGVSIFRFTEFPWGNLNIVDVFILDRLATGTWAVILFVYLWCLGGLIGLWTQTGGAVRFAEWAAGHVVVGPRSAKFFAWLIGIVFHQGGTVSVVIAGTTVRPILDDHKVSKEEASFIVDSTASPVATLLPFNAFPLVVAAAVVGTIAMFPDTDAGTNAAISFFFESIIFNFYAIFAVLFTLLLSLHLIPAVFAMGKARRRVEETGELVRPGSKPLISKELTEVDVPSDYKTGLADFLLPLGVLLTVAIGPFMIMWALGNERSVMIELAFFLALMTAIFVALVKGMPWQRIQDGIIQGAKGVTMAAIILALAVSIQGVAVALGTGFYVAELLGDLPAFLLPTLLLFAAMLVAFSTGTSFGTFAILFPVAMRLAWAVGDGNVTFLSMSFAAIIGGSVFGDKASPISDTTILSSLATGCDVMDHVVSQLPYALAAVGLAAVLYLVLGIVMFL